MRSIQEWLSEQKAGDVMTKQVAVLRPADRLADAVNLFLRDQITGAPVVDDEGVCVGILSATDIVSFEEKRATAPEPKSRPQRRRFDSWDWGEQWWREFGRISHELQPRLEQSVCEYMTRDVVSVAEDTPLAIVVRDMVDAHVHRVLVLDSARRLQGIISTMDVLSAVLQAGRREQSLSRSIA